MNPEPTEDMPPFPKEAGYTKLQQAPHLRHACKDLKLPDHATRLSSLTRSSAMSRKLVAGSQRYPLRQGFYVQ